MIKDLRNLGRDMKRMILIDDTEENYITSTPFNGITIQPWQNDMNDNTLELLIPFLKDIVISNIDVTQILIPEIKNEIIYKCL